MYHHRAPQQGPPQGFSNRPRPSHHQHPNQPPGRPATDVMSQPMSYQFPRPTQLPDELESALAIRSSRDMDHRMVDHMNRSNQHQNQDSAMGQRSSESGSYGSSSIPLISDNQPGGHQQGADWSSYKQPNKMFGGPPSRDIHQPQRQPQNSYSGTSMQSWNPSVSDPPPQARGHPGGGTGSGGNSGGVDGHGVYTPESAGSILASFGLSNEDLEVLSHYPDDQLTPDTLPFILRDIQINKSNKNSTAVSSSSSNFSQSISHGIHNVPQSTSRLSPLRKPRSNSPEVPSLLSVTQTAGKVIDYGHASRATDESRGRDTFQREPLSSERTVKMVYSPPPPVPKHKAEAPERRMHRLEPSETNKHGDLDYRRPTGDIHKSKRSPVREFPMSKHRRPDRDYRRDGPHPSTLSGTRSESSSLSRHPASASKAQGGTKRLPNPTMISDFSAEPPKVYPHTCSLCHTQCDQAKDWIEHVNTVNHTAACRDLRNKYPDWKPNLKRRNPFPAKDDGRAPWPAKGRSPSHSISRSLSWSPSPPPSKRRLSPHPQRPHENPYPPHHRLRHHHHSDHTHRSEPFPSGGHSPSRSNRGSSSSSGHQPEKRAKESSGVSTGSSRSSLKRSHDDSAKSGLGTNSTSSSTATKLKQSPKAEPPQSSNKAPIKMASKPPAKATKTAATTEAETTPKAQVAKKKKKPATPLSQVPAITSCQVTLTDILKDTSVKELSHKIGVFEKTNIVVRTAGSGEEGEKEKDAEQKVEDAQTQAQSTSPSVKDQQNTTPPTTEEEAEKSSLDTDKGKPSQPKSKNDADAAKPGSKAEQTGDEQKGLVLIAALPETGWSESDIIKLTQPFGTPSDIILAKEIGKVLVSLPTVDMAEEMVKVHSFVPAKISDSELKMTSLKLHISLKTPVAVYNLLKRPLDPLEASAPVGWSSLLVITNVPDTLTGPTEVQKLIKRFGTVKNTLVLNNNMIICEMATAAMALAVHKRFQKFPCIIQNSPLSFTREADPKPTITQSKVIPTCVDSPKAPPANGIDGQETSTATKENMEAQEERQSVSEAKESDEKNGEKTEGEKTGEGKAGEDESEENDDRSKQPEAAGEVCDPVQAESEADADASKAETVAVKTAIKPPASNKTVPPSHGEENSKAPSEPEETETCDDGETLSAGCADSLPKVTQEMADLLREECRKTISQSNQTASTPDGEKEEAKITGGENKDNEAQEGTKELATKDDEKKKPERKEREKERKGQRQEWERRHREVRREREERWRRDRDKRREEERKEEERRERERRERRRTHRESSAGSRSSARSEGSRRSSRRDAKDKKVEEEEELDEFPFDFGDFVTVDEVGDVADLPSSPPPSVDMEATEEMECSGEPPATAEDSTSVQEDTDMATTPPTIVETACSEPPPINEQSEGLDSQSEIPDSQFVVLDSHSEVPESQPEVPESQPEVPESQPEVPESQPEVPESQPDIPESQAEIQDSQPEVPESQSEVPESKSPPESSPAAPEASASITLKSSSDLPLTSTPKATHSSEQKDTEPDGAATQAMDSNTVTKCLPTSAPEVPPEAVSDAAPSSSTESPATVEVQEGKQETGHPDCTREEEQTSAAADEKEEVKPTQDKREEKGTVEGEESEDERVKEQESVKEEKIQTPTDIDSLPPFDPDNAVGMEFLVPKTGFFCKVCNRFFTGSQTAEMSHCKSLKHYENLQKYLKTRKMANTSLNESS